MHGLAMPALQLYEQFMKTGVFQVSRRLPDEAVNFALSLLMSSAKTARFYGLNRNTPDAA